MLHCVPFEDMHDASPSGADTLMRPYRNPSIRIDQTSMAPVLNPRVVSTHIQTAAARTGPAIDCTTAQRLIEGNLLTRFINFRPYSETRGAMLLPPGLSDKLHRAP